MSKPHAGHEYIDKHAHKIRKRPKQAHAHCQCDYDQAHIVHCHHSVFGPLRARTTLDDVTGRVFGWHNVFDDNLRRLGPKHNRHLDRDTVDRLDGR